MIDDRLYIGTGLRNNYTNTFYRYDPSRDTWTQVAGLPADGRFRATGFAIGAFGYVGLGSNCLGPDLCTYQYFSDFWRYDPANDTWTRVSDLPAEPREYAASFVIGGKAYVVGGSGNRHDAWEYDPSVDSWEQRADFPGRCGGRGTGFSVGGSGYVGFGFADGACKEVWRFDPGTNAWAPIAAFPGSARWDAIGLSSASTGFVLGGARQGPTYLDDVWIYDPASDAWTEVGTTLPIIGRSQMIAEFIGGKIFLGLGTKNEGLGPPAYFDDLWEYTPDR